MIDPPKLDTRFVNEQCEISAEYRNALKMVFTNVSNGVCWIETDQDEARCRVFRRLDALEQYHCGAIRATR